MDPVSDDATAPCLIWSFFHVLPRTGVVRCFVVLHGLESSFAGSFPRIEDLRVRISTTFWTFYPGWQGASVFMDISRTFPFLDWNPGYCLFSTPRDHFCSLYTGLARQPVSCLFIQTKSKNSRTCARELHAEDPRNDFNSSTGPFY